MTALLYMAYHSELSEAEKREIDKAVFENRRAISKFFKYFYGKGKVIVISTALGAVVFFSEMGNANAIGVTPIHYHQAPLMRSADRSPKVVPSKVT